MNRLLVLFLLASCFSPPAPPPCGVRCLAGDCPSGTECMADQFCHPPGDTEMCGPPIGQGAAIAAGERHTCAVFAGGVAACTGDNGLGQLGSDSARTGRAAPVESAGVFTAIVAGRHHSCATDEGAQLWCWGDNAAGQLGAGTPGSPTGAPVQVTEGPPGFDSVTAGGEHTCGIYGGEVWCWGQNRDGQLGLGPGSDVEYSRPQRVGTRADWQSVTAGERHTCAVRTGGIAACWGANDASQLGLGDTAPRDEPSDLTGTWGGLVAGSSHTCAVAADDGALWCWGDNTFGQLGTLGPSQPEPVRSDGRAWNAIASGLRHGCGITEGALYCWGSNRLGQLGDGEHADAARPMTRVGDQSTWVSVTAATMGEHTCARQSGGQLFCWGGNGDGQLGDGTIADKREPVQIGSDMWIAVDAGETATCAIKSDDTAWCWGDNNDGQLGVGGQGDRLTPAPVVDDGGITGWIAIDVGFSHACGIDEGERLWCWGEGSDGELGTGTGQDAIEPQPVGSDLWRAVSAGLDHTCGIRIAASGDPMGTLWCWGLNDELQLGQGSFGAMALAPESPVSGVGWLDVQLGRDHTCGHGDSGIYCWGANRAGEVGSSVPPPGNLAAPADPVAGGNPTDWLEVSLGDDFPAHTCGINAGLLWCWGSDLHGRLGLGPGSDDASQPADLVMEGLGWTQISAGRTHTCALHGSELFCWGGGDLGQLGNGILDSYDAPSRIGVRTDWLHVSAGGGHTCALDQAGLLWCWGWNPYGQLGDGTGARLVPTPVMPPP
jgi:alpha-tubulin suppressor-like RCC1 family protein